MDIKKDSVYAIKFATMQKQIDEKDKRIKELEDEVEKWKALATQKLIENKANSIKIESQVISKQKIQDKIEELNKQEKKELKGTKGQDRYSIKQEFMYKRLVLQELLEDKGE